MARHVSLMLEMKSRGSITFDYGNNLRKFAKQGGEADAFGSNGFVLIVRPLFHEEKVHSDGQLFLGILKIYIQLIKL